VNPKRLRGLDFKRSWYQSKSSSVTEHSLAFLGTYCLTNPLLAFDAKNGGITMRLMEGMRLRIKDIDFDRHVIIVRDAKGGKDRVVMLPRCVSPALRVQMLAAHAQWEADRQAQRDGVETPHALETKYPKVGYTWGWFWMFPSPTLSIDPRSGVERRLACLRNVCKGH
jgi:hypothetical protein